MSKPGELKFGAPWGRALKVISIGASALLAGVAFIGAWQMRNSTAGALMVAGPVLLLGICALFVVRGYSLEHGNLLVRRLLWVTTIPLAGLQKVDHAPEAIRGSIRLFGNGGLYSFTGIFRNKRLGIYRAYVNDLNRAVVLKLPTRTVVVSPDNPEVFTNAVARAAGLNTTVRN